MLKSLAMLVTFLAASVLISCNGSALDQLTSGHDAGGAGGSSADASSGGASGGGSAGSASGGTSGAGAGGSSGSGGVAGGGGVAGSGGTDAGTDGSATKCTGSCPEGQVCSGCAGQGTCVPDPGGSEPVCGCNGVTYANASLANHLGVSVFHLIACPQNIARKCQNDSCATGQYCDREQTASAGVCSGTSVDTCWVLPATCPVTPTGKACAGATGCKSDCDLIKTQQPWYPTSSCP